MRNFDWKRDPRVFLVPADSYPEEPPFDPSQPYPERPFPRTASKPNPVYDAVRRLFALAGLDRGNFGGPKWNPLKGFVNPGERIFINFEAGAHSAHPSLLRAIMDYIYIAMEGKGRIDLGFGSPTGEAPPPLFMERVKKVVQLYSSGELKIRILIFPAKHRKKEEGDPSGYTMVDLADSSEFSSYTGNWQLRSSSDTKAPLKSHKPGIHKYILSSSAMKADAMINAAKLETHDISCLALTLMNCLNMVEDRSLLPYFSAGPPAKGGDEFPYSGKEKGILYNFKKFLLRLAESCSWARKLLAKASRNTIMAGSWWGNDTLWRTVIDLNKVLLYFNEEGELRNNPLRLLNFVDGIVSFQHSEEGAGKRTGILLFGQNPVAVDCAAAWLAGVDWKKVPLLRKAFEIKTFPLTDFKPEEIEVISEDIFVRGKLETIEPITSLNLPAGWKDKAELKF